MEVNTFLGDLGGLPRWQPTHLEPFKKCEIYYEVGDW